MAGAATATATAAAAAAAAAADPASIRWRWCRFEVLTVFELESIYRARQQVFGLEQQCLYEDIDGRDEAAFHLAAWSSSQPPGGRLLLLAYARLTDPGVIYAEPSMGRVITVAAVRRTGLGRALVERLIASSEAAFPGRGIRISAQSRLEAFYATLGFVSVGAPYLEDGIAHIQMFRP